MKKIVFYRTIVFFIVTILYFVFMKYKESGNYVHDGVIPPAIVMYFLSFPFSIILALLINFMIMPFFSESLQNSYMVYAFGDISFFALAFWYWGYFVPWGMKKIKLILKKT